MKFIVPDSARSRHVYIAGKPGQGKSTLMFWMALQDIDAGKAVCVLDPNGDLVEDLLNRIPPAREEDVIYLDGLQPIPLDFMAWHDDLDRAILSDDLITMFKRLSEGEWGPRMDAIMNYAVLTVLEARKTFLDIYRLLTNDTFRQSTILPAIRHNSVLTGYWEGEYKHLPKDAASPITSRMAKYLLTPSLKTTLGHPEPELKIPAVIQKNQVLLVNLNKIGQRAGNVYGSLIVAQIQQAIFRRGHLSRDERNALYLYVDEFQDFSGSSFSKILSQARKFNLGLTLANQFPKQVGDLMEDIRGCVSSYILFQMDQDHANVLKSAIRPYKPEQLADLQPFHALYHAVDGSTHFDIKTPTWPPAPTPQQRERARRITQRTLTQYARTPGQDDDPDPESGYDAKPGHGPFPTNEGKTRGPRRTR